MKPCPYCAEEIQDRAIKCKHCGEWLEVNRPRSTLGDQIKRSRLAVSAGDVAPPSRRVSTDRPETQTDAAPAILVLAAGVAGVTASFLRWFRIDVYPCEFPRESRPVDVVGVSRTFGTIALLLAVVLIVLALRALQMKASLPVVYVVTVSLGIVASAAVGGATLTRAANLAATRLGERLPRIPLGICSGSHLTEGFILAIVSGIVGALVPILAIAGSRRTNRPPAIRKPSRPLRRLP